MEEITISVRLLEAHSRTGEPHRTYHGNTVNVTLARQGGDFTTRHPSRSRTSATVSRRASGISLRAGSAAWYASIPLSAISNAGSRSEGIICPTRQKNAAILTDCRGFHEAWTENPLSRRVREDRKRALKKTKEGVLDETT